MRPEEELVATLGEREFWVWQASPHKWMASDKNTRTGTEVRKPFKTKQEATDRCIAWCDAVKQFGPL